MKWRVSILAIDGKVYSNNFCSKEDCEDWILNFDIKLKKSIILNKDNKERFIMNWVDNE